MTKELTPLQALERLRPTTTYQPYYSRNERRYCCDIIETALKEYELMKEIRITARFDLAQVNKEHKALELIKTKKVNVRCIMSGWVLGKYNSYKTHIKLTEEEYELLKEVLL